jgi:catechol 2,3-dioxygenase-like lactoylglutathione lyase family enzyme
MIRFTGVNHLAFATGDMDKTVQFWRDLLGMRLVTTMGQTGFRHYFFELSPTDLVAFFEWQGVEGIPEKPHGMPVRGPFIFDHVSFGVENADDLWALKDKFMAAGLEVSDVIDHGFVHSIYTFDPNGIPIEFSYDVPGFDVRQRPLFGDRTPTAITQEGADPVPGRWPTVQQETPCERRFALPGAGSELARTRLKKAS